MSGRGLFKSGLATKGLGSLKRVKRHRNPSLRVYSKDPTPRVYALYDAKRIDALLAEGMSLSAACRLCNYSYKQVYYKRRIMRTLGANRHE
jgi:hypothetical protein